MNSSQLSATDAGTYKIYCRLKNDLDRWYNNATNADGEQEFTWTINKLDGILSLSISSLIVLHKSNKTEVDSKTIQVREASGDIVVSSSNTSVARISYDQSSNLITVTASSVGNCTISITSQANINYTAKTITISVVVDNIIQDDYATIQQRVKAGQAQNYYNLGDLIPIAVNGSTGGASLYGTYYGCIVDFDHKETPNSAASHTMSLKYPYSSTGKALAFIDGNYDKYIYNYYDTIVYIRNNAPQYSSYIACKPGFCVYPRLPNGVDATLSVTSEYYGQYLRLNYANPNYLYPQYIQPIVDALPIDGSFRNILKYRAAYTQYLEQYPPYATQFKTVGGTIQLIAPYEAGYYGSDYSYDSNKYMTRFQYLYYGSNNFKHYAHTNHSTSVKVWARGIYHTDSIKIEYETRNAGRTLNPYFTESGGVNRCCSGKSLGLAVILTIG